MHGLSVYQKAVLKPCDHIPSQIITRLISHKQVVRQEKKTKHRGLKYVNIIEGREQSITSHDHEQREQKKERGAMG